MTMMMRIAKSQTSSWIWTVGEVRARGLLVDREQDERDERHARHAVGLEAVGLGPTESPALSPTQSAMTPGLRASSSLILKTIFMRSEPMSAILVKMPPAIRSAWRRATHRSQSR
jgi:hypothetical protein